ncbi:PleD family two-component system response regulator [Aurantimonas sp. Leaf443]|uniref:PleD family two-component system response regulator n=1 Tax=Aurantimonas sp. Leaf443 TaxID=1736378 RepID=UPI0007002447|nr:PleD family two-component system response regulator [Aurantimonas sp. Leaf443]KQT86307.1 response regulator PleD [Aurantimonas sp. Leaf443]
MTARILVVDDLEVNVRLLEVRLAAEYFEVVTAHSGAQALAAMERDDIDLVLLDVMMPDMDGYEVCRRLKANPATQHVPVVLITALDQPADRVTGLEAGADDFLTKPVRDLQLFSRVRSLTRLKLMTDELRRRAASALSVVTEDAGGLDEDTALPGQAVAFLAPGDAAERHIRSMRPEIDLSVFDVPAAFLAQAGAAAMDLAIVDLDVQSVDPLRLVSQLRSAEATRRLPILVLTPMGDEARAARALELGATDYIQRPLDRNELLARMRTQVRRRRYDRRLSRSLEQTIEFAVTDPLTGLPNRRFLDAHLAQAVARAQRNQGSFALLIADIDHFKRINDGFGHDAGDAVLQEFARRLRASVRASDLPCRYGGEEFMVLMPDADGVAAMRVAERLRLAVSQEGFPIAGEVLAVTVSAGLAVFDPQTDDAASLVKRADEGLYEAKRHGRNRVMSRAA